MSWQFGKKTGPELLEDIILAHCFGRLKQRKRDWRFLGLRWRVETDEERKERLVSHAHSLTDRAAEKQASRDQDVRDLASGKKTAAELHEENKAFRLSGAKIDWNKSKSKLW